MKQPKISVYKGRVEAYIDVVSTQMLVTDMGFWKIYSKYGDEFGNIPKGISVDQSIEINTSIGVIGNYIEVTYTSALTLDELIYCIGYVRDAHVLTGSVQPIDKYTGERAERDISVSQEFKDFLDEIIKSDKYNDFDFNKEPIV